MNFAGIAGILEAVLRKSEVYHILKAPSIPKRAFLSLPAGEGQHETGEDCAYGESKGDRGTAAGNSKT